MPLFNLSRLPRIIPVLLLIAWCLCIAWLSLTTQTGKVYGFRVWDKLAHAGSYALLAYLAALVALRYFPTRPTSWRWAAIGAWLFGVLMEVGQGVLTRGRKASVGDVIANTVGIFAVCFIGALLARRRQRRINKDRL